MSKAAPEELLEGLHNALAEEMKRMLEAGGLSASDLNVIRQFLKDNGIDAALAEGGTLPGLAEKMAEIGADEEGDPESYH